MNDWETCFHEAGHAVVAIARRQKFDYVTMNPRDKNSTAHMRSDDQHWSVYEKGHWKAWASISAAGILAEEAAISKYSHFDPFTKDSLREVRKELVRENGRDDMKSLRKYAWLGWERARTEGDMWSATQVDPDKSPVDLAVDAWSEAAMDLTVHWSYVIEVAYMLHDSTRKVTFREIVAMKPDFEAHSKLFDEPLEPWFLEHSRLKWTPSDRWFAEVERFAEMRRQHEAETAARCADCGCPA